MTCNAEPTASVTAEDSIVRNKLDETAVILFRGRPQGFSTELEPEKFFDFIIRLPDGASASAHICVRMKPRQESCL
jgi:hypothetical protein